MFQSLSLLPQTRLLGTWLTLAVHHLLLNIPVLHCFHLSKRRTSTATLRTVLDKHAPPSLRKVINHNSSPWCESIRVELFNVRRDRRQAERKWKNTKLTIFEELYKHANHKVSKLVHTAKCNLYTGRIALAYSSKKLYEIVNRLSNRQLCHNQQ